MQEGWSDLMLRHRRARPVAWVVNAVLALLVAWALARIVWLALGAGLPTAAVAPAASPGDASSESSAPAQPLATWHLFGTSLVAPDSRTAVETAPDTSLKLTLRGIVAQDDPKTGRAIIVDEAGREQVYTAGKQVSGGVTVDAIYPDRVMLVANGRVEALRLPKPDEGRAAATPGGGAANAPVGTPGIVAPLPGSLRNTAPAAPLAGPITGAPAIPANTIDWNAATQKLGVDPRELAKQVQVAPVMEDGKFTGVRFTQGASHPALAKLGLKPDDVVTSVNGIPLDNFSRAQAVQDSIASSRTLNVTVKRGGRTENLSVSLE